jgi:hypothetical protein
MRLIGLSSVLVPLKIWVFLLFRSILGQFSPFASSEGHSDWPALPRLIARSLRACSLVSLHQIQSSSTFNPVSYESLERKPPVFLAQAISSDQSAVISVMIQRKTSVRLMQLFPLFSGQSGFEFDSSRQMNGSEEAKAAQSTRKSSLPQGKKICRATRRRSGQIGLIFIMHV